MSFRINTNVNALNTHANAVSNNVDLSKSLNKLSSGLRIQTAADDASGLSIADSLRSQASALGQAIANGNDAIGIIQVADKAMDEQLKVLDTIKTKATQSAQDGQTTQSRQALQADIVRLMEELDNIGNTTSFNGQQLLNGTFSNKEFQIGAYSNQTVKASIGATTSDKIGLTRFESSGLLSKMEKITLTFKNVDGVNDVKVASAVISTGLGNGLGALAENINKVADKTGVRATFDVTRTMSTAIVSASIKDFKINGVIIGDLDVKANDKNGALVNAINAVKDQTGVEASVNTEGRMVLTSRDGRAMSFAGTNIEKVIGAKDKEGKEESKKGCHYRTTKVSDGSSKKSSNGGVLEPDGTGSHTQSVPNGFGLIFKPEDLPEELKKYAIDPTSLGIQYGAPFSQSLTGPNSGGWIDFVGDEPGQCTELAATLNYALWEKDGSHFVNVQGNGKQVASNIASQLGISVSNTPKTGAVFSTSYSNAYGHVGIISHVFENGDVLLIEQNISKYSGASNGTPNTWDYRLVSKASYGSEFDSGFTCLSDAGFTMVKGVKTLGK